jgi:predicted tellurium resistance membrane protein TerC
MSDIFTTTALISLLTLTFLEIVLGIDNIIFISIVAGKLPKNQQKRARTIGLMLALVMRVGLLATISWLASASEALFTLPFSFLSQEANEISIRDLILFIGGLFLMSKSTTEIHSKIEGEKEKAAKNAKVLTLNMAVAQIVMLDIVFSFDSILTAVGLTSHLEIMISAVIISMLIMLVFAEKVSNFVNDHPTVKMLALSFLLMIGMLLVLDAFAVHVPKGYVYFSIAFSLFVEMLNLRMRKKAVK